MLNPSLINEEHISVVEKVDCGALSFECLKSSCIGHNGHIENGTGKSDINAVIKSQTTFVILCESVI